MKYPVSNNFVISADIGGSHITAAVIDLSKKEIIDDTRIRLDVNSQGTWADILGTWVEALRQARSKFNQPTHQVALAMPGPFDYENGISLINGLHKYDAIYGHNIKVYMAAELDIEPENILFRNDAEAFLHGEVVAGAGLGYNKVIGITLGTGLGSARSSQGKTEDVNRGSSDFYDSIADNYMSTRWFVKRYHELTGKPVANVKELAALAESEHDAGLVFKEFTANLVLFLTNFINAEQPDVVIIGGNIARASSLFYLPLQYHLGEFFDTIDIKIAELGEDSSLMGAAAAFQNKINSADIETNKPI